MCVCPEERFPWNPAGGDLFAWSQHWQNGGPSAEDGPGGGAHCVMGSGGRPREVRSSSPAHSEVNKLFKSRWIITAITKRKKISQNFKKRFYLFIFRERGREEEGERNISVWLPLVRPLLGTWPVTLACALTGNRRGDPLVLRLALNHWATLARSEIF